MFTEKTALGILAIVSIIAAGGLFALQDADTSVNAQASSYYFLTRGDAQSMPPNKNVDVRGEVPIQCQMPADCPESYDCKTTKVTVKYFNYEQEEYQKRCVKIM